MLNTPVDRRVALYLEKAQKKKDILYPDPDYMPIRDSYHRMIGGGRVVLPGNNGHYQPAEYDEMSVSSYPKPIGLPKPVGAGRSGGKRKTLIARNLEQIGEYIKPVGKPLVELAQKTIQKKIDKLEGKGRSGGRTSGGAKSGGEMSGGSKQKARGLLVSKLMKEHGMTLPEASRHIKEKGLM